MEWQRIVCLTAILFISVVAASTLVSCDCEAAVTDQSGQDGNITWSFYGYNTLYINSTIDNAYMRPYSGTDRPNWEQFKNVIESIIISDKIAGVGAYAFDNYPNLKYVSFGSNVVIIGDGAFRNCTNLSSLNGIYKHNNVAIESEAFRNTAITELRLNTGYVGSYSFADCKQLTTVNLYYTKYINTCAFNGCESLIEFTAPSTLEMLGQYAFYSCKMLQKASFENATKLTEIPKATFNHCTNLRTVILPNSVIHIQELAFSDTGLTNITLPSQLYHVGPAAFYMAHLTEIILPNSVMWIEHDAFGGNNNVKTVQIYGPIAEIGEYAFGDNQFFVKNTKVTATASNLRGHIWEGDGDGKLYRDGIKQITVTFDGNGGTPSYQTAIASDNGTVPNLPSATKNGYSFGGWYTDKDGGSRITTSYVFTTDTTVYAHWEKQYVVYFNLDGGSNGPRTITTSDNYIIIPNITPVKDGYDFGGWVVKNSGGSAYYGIGVKVFLNAPETTLTANWTEKTDYTLIIIAIIAVIAIIGAIYFIKKR